MKKKTGIICGAAGGVVVVAAVAAAIIVGVAAKNNGGEDVDLSGEKTLICNMVHEDVNFKTQQYYMYFYKDGKFDNRLTTSARFFGLSDYAKENWSNYLENSFLNYEDIEERDGVKVEITDDSENYAYEIKIEYDLSVTDENGEALLEDDEYIKMVREKSIFEAKEELAKTGDSSMGTFVKCEIE